MSAIAQLLLQTFVHPRELAMGMVAERYERHILWTGAFLVIVLSGIVQYGLVYVTPENELTKLLFTTPLVTTVMVGCGIIVLVFAIYFGGQMMGGTGHFPETLLLMVWLQFAQVVVGAIQIVIIAISPALVGVAALVGLMGGAGIFYATLQFIDVLHGFKSLWAAFGTLVISFLGLAVGLVIILAVIGGAAVQTGAV